MDACVYLAYELLPVDSGLAHVETPPATSLPGVTSPPEADYLPATGLPGGINVVPALADPQPGRTALTTYVHGAATSLTTILLPSTDATCPPTLECFRRERSGDHRLLVVTGARCSAGQRDDGATRVSGRPPRQRAGHRRGCDRQALWHTVRPPCGGHGRMLGVLMDEAESPSDRQLTDEAALVPPPEWGKERSPIVSRIIAVTVAAVCVIVAAGIAIWGFDLLGSEEAPSAERPDSALDAAATSSTTPTPRGANEANVGDCVKVVKGGLDAELEVVECGTADARYVVAIELEMQEHCPAGPYLEYSVTGLGAWSLCLVLNAAVGQCYKNNVTDGFTLTECAAADFEVVAVLADRADKNACPSPPPNALFHPEPLVYPTPPLTICLARTVR